MKGLGFADQLVPVTTTDSAHVAGKPSETTHTIDGYVPTKSYLQKQNRKGESTNLPSPLAGCSWLTCLRAIMIQAGMGAGVEGKDTQPCFEPRDSLVGEAAGSCPHHRTEAGLRIRPMLSTTVLFLSFCLQQVHFRIQGENWQILCLLSTLTY